MKLRDEKKRGKETVTQWMEQRVEGLAGGKTLVNWATERRKVWPWLHKRTWGTGVEQAGLQVTWRESKLFKIGVYM